MTWTDEQWHRATLFGICWLCRTPFNAGWITMEDGNTGTGRYCETPDCSNYRETVAPPEMPEHLRSIM